jgi:hypothetical protein
VSLQNAATALEVLAKLRTEGSLNAFSFVEALVIAKQARAAIAKAKGE